MLYMIERAQDSDGFIVGWYVYRDDIDEADIICCIMDLVGSGVSTSHFRVYEKTSPHSFRISSLSTVFGAGITTGEIHEHH